jgi:DNA topoisomerase-3
MRLVIAEKPSVARDLARVLGAVGKRNGWFEGEGLRVSWCVGHVAQLEEPAFYRPEWKRWSQAVLPMVPEAFAIAPRKGLSEHLGILRGLLRDHQVRQVVNACDAGREGELIFRWLVELVGCKAPVSRLWISSLTDEAIRDGWAKLAPSRDFDRLGDAARCRAEADWLVGMNATRALTCAAREAGGIDVFSVGRVQTPTLAMIVARDQEIAEFVPKEFWQVHATFRADRGTWRAVYVPDPAAPAEPDGPDTAPRAERIPTAALAQAIAAAVEGRQGVVTVADRRRTVEQPPLLYDLTALQRRANQRYGLSAPRTLAVAQALYERHKLITYPRTDARYLTPDQVAGLPALVAGLRPLPPYREVAERLLAAPIRPGRRVVDASEVGDHHAILPTGKTPNPERLDPDEKRIFDLVARRFLAVLCPPAEFDVTLLVAEVEPAAPLEVASPLHFRARGRVRRAAGWQAIDPPPASKDVELPPVDVGDAAVAVDPEVSRGQTRPPPPMTDAAILRAMETAGRTLDDEELARRMRGCGLGTPATRASILEVLVERKYVERRQRELRATDRGKAVIGALRVEELKSAELTGRWEGKLLDIAEGRGERPAFMEAVRDHVARIVADIGSAPPIAGVAVEGEVLGTCPACGQLTRQRGRGWECEARCGFSIPGMIARREVSARMAKELITGGRTKPVKGFHSKAGKVFTAGLRWDPEARKVAFWFPERAPPAPSPPRVVLGAACPSCGNGRIIQGRKALGCDRWREGCTFVAG